MLHDLYQQTILDHSRQPRHKSAMPDATCTIKGYNPICGDEVTLCIKQAADTIEKASFTGTGCAICTASASMMLDAIQGMHKLDALKLFEAFHAMLQGQAADEATLGKLMLFQGVTEFPSRIKCASLAWHALAGALKEAQPSTITTE